MRFFIFLVNIFFLGIQSLYGQIILNNDTTICSMQTISLNALSSEPSSIGQDDRYDSIRNIGFNFDFYGNTYNKCVISENGYITFDTLVANGNTPYSITVPLPNPGSDPENAIMAPWHDLYVPAGGGIYFGTTGIAPNRIFLVTWCLVPMYSCNVDLFTAQIVLYEGSNIIEMFIKDKPLCLAWNGGAAVQGLVDATSTNFDIVIDPTSGLSRNFPLQWTAINEGWQFISSGVTSYTINAIPYSPIIAGSVSWSDSAGNILGTGSSVSVTPLVTSKYFATMISNCSGVILDSITITIDISNNSFDTIYADSMVFSPIDTGVFVNQTYTVAGCDTAFVDSIIHQRLGVQINYNINNPGTATFSINGTIQSMPYSENYWAGETISIAATLQPNWAFVKWRTNNNFVLPNTTSMLATFTALLSDSCVLATTFLNAFISGNDTICDNEDSTDKLKVYFRGGNPPFRFVYEINGISQPSVKTSSNPYIINTKQDGFYTLLSFSDSLSQGVTSGSAVVKILQSPTADFEAQPDSMTIIYTTSQMIDKSLSDTGIATWQWNFGDNSANNFSQNPYHTYPDSIDIYQVSLIIEDKNGCTDTVFKQVWVTDDHWIYIPNSFTPDLDGINDVFCIQYNGIRLETFYFNVYDRFSNLVYSTSNISELECDLGSNGWDGSHYLSKKELPLGTYIYEIYFQDFEGWKHQDMGKLSIIR